MCGTQMMITRSKAKQLAERQKQQPEEKTDASPSAEGNPNVTLPEQEVVVLQPDGALGLQPSKEGEKISSSNDNESGSSSSEAAEDCYKPRGYKNLGRKPFPPVGETFGPGFVEIALAEHRTLRAASVCKWVPEALQLGDIDDYVTARYYCTNIEEVFEVGLLHYHHRYDGFGEAAALAALQDAALWASRLNVPKERRKAQWEV